MFLTLFLFILLFAKCYGCLATPASDATPEVPVLLCTTCADLQFTAAPNAQPGPGGFNTGTGTITMGTVGPGCRQYTVTCNTNPNGAMRAVVIGANMMGISLSEPSGGEKMATLVCNEQGMIEGRTVPANDPVIVTSVYCSNENNPVMMPG